MDCGKRPAKAAVGDLVRVEADIVADGHDALWCELRAQHDADRSSATIRMEPIGNDRWRATLPITKTGGYRFKIRSRVDPFATWTHDLRARADAGQDYAVELLVGAQLIADGAGRVGASRASRALHATLTSLVKELESARRGLDSHVEPALAEWFGPAATSTAPTASTPVEPTLRDVLFSPRLEQVMGELGDPAHFTNSPTLRLTADEERARFSAWYELFPRSASSEPGRHGTFQDVRRRLDYVEAMGFDVLYLPPIHPIGHTGRKGRNGAVAAAPDDPGSPWAIGAAEGGHDAIHPQLGTLSEFRALVEDAAGRGIAVALDLAFQCSPDHPWVTEHPGWFKHRPDGTIRYAENPPKHYEDIYPLDFDSADWQGLWSELLRVVEHWIAEGISVFRVDNPHTKPFAFWEWLIETVHAEHPEVIFLAEAFTRPRIMEQLAKIGFTQSYTYFAWRTSKHDIESYLHELTRTEVADYVRPNFWPSTPDILTEELQVGGRAAFLARFVLAATSSASYGIYGPTFELQEHVPRSPGSEEFDGSEKYEIRSWDLERPDSLAAFIGLVNRARREHPALQFNDALLIHRVDNDQIVVYSKTRPTETGTDAIVVVVSVDHAYVQSGWVDLDLDALGIDPDRPYEMHDLLTGADYIWNGPSNFVKLDPTALPCHVFAVSQPGEGESSERTGRP